MKEEKKSIVSRVIMLLVMTFVIMGIVAIFYFNVGNIKEKVINPTLKKIPIINNLINIKEDVKTEYEDVSREELIIKINNLNEQLESNQKKIDDLNIQSDNYLIEIERLKKFEDEYVSFLKDKEEFDKYIVTSEKSPSLEVFADYYNKIYPKNADKIYREVILEIADNENLKKYAETYQQMDSINAAAIITELSVTDMELAITILNNIDSSKRSEILGSMSAKIASRITKRMAP